MIGMSVAPGNVLLYPADPKDYDMALAAAGVAGIPVTPNVLGNFSDIWIHTNSGTYLVMAVGGNANTALYYNPCSWSNPPNDSGGSTPFKYAAEPQSTLPGATYFENAAGTTALGTLKAATMLAYYAVHGVYPSGYGSLPPLEAASTTCPGPPAYWNQGCTC